MFEIAGTILIALVIFGILGVIGYAVWATTDYVHHDDEQEDE